MTDAELLEFCDEMEKAAKDPSYVGPCAEWNDGQLEVAALAATRAARSSVALRAQVATLREALEKIMRFTDDECAETAARKALAATEPPKETTP